MSQTIIEGARLESGSTGKIINVGLWILQIGAAGMFLMVGFLKLSGDPQMIALFDAIGSGQWFRYVTGSLEVLGAVPTHLFVVGGSPLPAIILLIVTGVTAWGRRQRTMNVLAGLR